MINLTPVVDPTFCVMDQKGVERKMHPLDAHEYKVQQRGRACTFLTFYGVSLAGASRIGLREFLPPYSLSNRANTIIPDNKSCLNELLVALFHPYSSSLSVV